MPAFERSSKMSLKSLNLSLIAFSCDKDEQSNGKEKCDLADAPRGGGRTTKLGIRDKKKIQEALKAALSSGVTETVG